MAENDDEIKDNPQVGEEDQGPNSNEVSAKENNSPSALDSQANSENIERLEPQSDPSAISGEESTGQPNVIHTSDQEEVPNGGDGGVVDEFDLIASNQHDGVVISKGLSIEPEKEKVKLLQILREFIKSIPPEVKKKSLIASLILLLASIISYFLLQGMLLPRFAFPYRVSYKELAQEVYSYPTDGLVVPLFDDSRSKSFTVALPKATINLRGEGNEPDYGEFEFFLNLRDRDLVIQVNGQQSEIIEIVRRGLENVSWNELQTPLGKDRVKKQIRSDVNKFLGGNMVLSVYYRSVILSR